MVSDVYYPFPGGITEHVHHLSFFLQKRGHNVVILTGNHKNGKNIGLNSVKVIRVGRGILVPVNRSFYSLPVSFNITSKIKEVLFRESWDIVHVHGTLSPTLPLFTLLQSPYVNFMTFHPTHGHSLGFEIFKPLLKRAFDKIEGKIAVSRSAMKSIKRHFDGEFRIIPNGVDTVRFGPHVAPFKGLKRPGEKIVLFVGRLEPRKGVGTLIKAFSIVSRKIKNVKLVIVGDAPLRKYFEVRARGLNINFLGKVRATDIPAIYRTADVFVAPATGKESFGIVLIEAMASMVPVVASDIEGYREILGNDGILVPPGNEKALAEALINLLKNPEISARLALQGRKKVVEHFSWEIVTNLVEDYYFEVLKNAQKVLH